MKNKRGFTLVELLCVIVIIALVTTIATTKVFPYILNGNEKTFCAKLEMIKSQALNYASKYEQELNESTEYFEGNKSIKIKINDLVLNKIIEADRNGLVIDPRNNATMNDLDVIFYLKNNRIYVYIDTNNVC